MNIDLTKPIEVLRGSNDYGEACFYTVPPTWDAETAEAYRRFFEAGPRMLVRLKKDEVELRHHVENPCYDSTPGEYKYEKAALRQRERDDLAELVALISEIEGTL
jgi:hypothetical protein